MRAARHVIGAALVLALGACTSAPGDDVPADPEATASSTASPSAPARAASYVALGDSFTSGPGIGEQQDGAGFCQRSDSNWPSLLATTKDLELDDVSCVGATTADLASTVGSGVVDAATRLVTIGTGGNDSGLFSSLITSCAGGGDACRPFVDDRLPRILEQTTRDIAALLTTVRETAPDATIVLVGYPRIVGSDACAALGIPDVELLASAEDALDRSLAAAAEQAGEEYVSVREASRGHDACAGPQAWTNGRTAAAGDGISFHPTARGMEAVADLVAARVGGQV